MVGNFTQGSPVIAAHTKHSTMCFELKASDRWYPMQKYFEHQCVSYDKLLYCLESSVTKTLQISCFCMGPWKHLTIPMWLPVTQHSHSVTQCFHHSVCLSWTQVFLKEKERQVLQDALNKEVMRRIIILQRWFRGYLIRLHFLQKKDATVIIQVQFVV